MNKIVLSLILSFSLLGCASGPVQPAWEGNAKNSLDASVSNYLSGNTKAEMQDYARAYKELSATGRADLLALAELTRCAARVASLEFDNCPKFKPLAQDSGPEQRAYADYLAGRWQGINTTLLPKHHAAVVNATNNPALLLQIKDPLSRLVAAGVMLQFGQLTPVALQKIAGIATQTASDQAWRRPLLAWLGMQVKQAEKTGDMNAAAGFKRRIELILGASDLKS